MPRGFAAGLHSAPMLASDRQLPVSGGPEKRAYVRDIFTAIAPTYDRLNRIISFRFDQGWRRYAVATAGVGAETGRNLPRPLRRDAGLRRHARRPARLPGPDRRRRLRPRRCCELGRRQGRRGWRRSPPMRSSCRFPMRAFDGAMVGWGVRNLVDLDAGLAEAARVLKPGRPAGDPRDGAAAAAAAPRGCTSSISGGCCRWIGRRDLETYDRLYLATRVHPARFPRRPSSRGGWRRRGSTRCRYELFMGGVCALHVGTRRERMRSRRVILSERRTAASRASRARRSLLRMTDDRLGAHGPRQPPRLHQGHRPARRAGAGHPPGARPPRDRRDRRPRA